MPIDRIARFLTDPAADSFEALAAAAFAFQFENIPAYRALCERRGVTPASLTDWRQVPAVPTTAFRSLTLAARPAEVIFVSSGTSQGLTSRSVHHQAFPELYRRVIEASFPPFCLPDGGRRPILSLVPPLADLPQSSLSFMVDHLLQRFGATGSVSALTARGLDFPGLRSWCSARQRERQPALVLTTALALGQALDRLERMDLRFRLPAGSVVFETGGFKGQAGELKREELLHRLEERLGVAREQVVREYGMTELTSQCYTRVLAGGDPDLFVAPHWVRAQVLDAETLDAAPPGSPGLIAVFDLANLNAAIHLLTEDLGVAESGGFRLLGRAEGAALRGCSLTAEELAGRAS